MDLTFGLWLKRRRRALDLTQEDLAERAYCSVNSIRKIESGDLTPSKALAQEIARALDISAAHEADFVRFARTPGAAASENAFVESPDAEPAPAPAIPDQASADAPKFYPPAALTEMVGRERDANVLREMLRLPAARLVTLTGAPGMGKTRLALDVATALADEYVHGAAFVSLAPVTAGDMVERAIVAELNVVASGSETVKMALRAFLRNKHLLLVLDNFEHVLDAAPLVGELLTAAPQLKILTTSREPLRVYGERELSLLSLALPPLSPLPPLEKLEHVSAVHLFVERARAVKPDFALTRANADAVARLCVLLDGLPLALEMAAARVKWETPHTLYTQLQDHVESLSGERNPEPRHRSLRSTMDWSFALLDESEQRVLTELSIFRGGFTLEAADAVCGEGARAVVTALAEKSLVKRENVAADETHYALLEMVREYAAEKLRAAGREDATAERHCVYYTALAKQIGTDMLQPESAQAIVRVQREQGNVRAALRWAIETRHGAHALELAGALMPFWYHTSTINEGAAWMDQVLSMNVALSSELAFTRARTRDGYAEFLRMTGDSQPARELMQDAVADWRRAGERGRPYLGFALLSLSRLALYQGDDELAHTCADEALEVYTALGDPVGQARAWRRLAEWALHDMDYAYSEECIAHAVELSAGANDLFERGVDLMQRGDLARARGKLELAQQDYKAAMRLNEATREAFMEARLARRLGLVATLRGEWAQGDEMLVHAGQLALKLNSRPTLAYVFAGMALNAALRKKTAEAMHRLGVMDALLETVQMVLIVPELLEYEQTLDLLNEQASQTRLEAWRAKGHTLSVEEMLREPLQD